MEVNGKSKLWLVESASWINLEQAILSDFRIIFDDVTKLAMKVTLFALILSIWITTITLSEGGLLKKLESDDDFSLLSKDDITKRSKRSANLAPASGLRPDNRRSYSDCVEDYDDDGKDDGDDGDDGGKDDDDDDGKDDGDDDGKDDGDDDGKDDDDDDGKDDSDDDGKDDNDDDGGKDDDDDEKQRLH
ncbi:hypothetical protein ACH3XW_2710 [Acanthocheilonema viteae]